MPRPAEPDLREALRALLAVPEHAPAPVARLLAERGDAGGRRLELRLGSIPATFLLPAGAGPFPAILYCHAHGGQYDLGRRELTEGARWLASPPAPDLTLAGFAVLCVDMPGFGDRQAEGSESALAKAGLWRGRPLFGQMVADQITALSWLTAQPAINASRIATFGMSMGAALAYWTGALDLRTAAVAQLCMLADIAPLIDAGVHDRHGHYLTVPGLLEIAETGEVAGLIAPRPQFVAHGAGDPLTPEPARRAALRRLHRAYGGSAALGTWIAPKSGHVETADMRRAVLDFLTRACASSDRRTRETC